MLIADRRITYCSSRAIEWCRRIIERSQNAEIKAVSLREAGNMVSPVLETEYLVLQKAPLRSSQWAGVCVCLYYPYIGGPCLQSSRPLRTFVDKGCSCLYPLGLTAMSDIK